MIKFAVPDKTGGKIIGLGISEMNVEKLREGLPILVDASELGDEFKGVKVFLFYGKTERDLLGDLKKHGLDFKHAAVKFGRNGESPLGPKD